MSPMLLLRRWWPVLLLLLVPAIPLWRVLAYGEGIGPFDQVRAMTIENGIADAKPWDVLQADGVLQFYPWRDMVFESWSNGQMPLWNPYELGGTPLLANSQSAGFYPPHILIGLARPPTGMAMVFLAWIHLFWAGLGVYALVRLLGGNRVGGAVAGISFTLSAFMLSWAALPSVITTVAWIPWVLACVLSLLGASARSERPRHGLRATCGLAASTGMMLLAGHLQFAAYGLFAAVLLAIWLAVTAKRGKVRMGLCVAGFALGAMLSAPQLLPVLKYSKFSHRQNVASEEGYQAYVQGAVSPFQLAGLVFPTALGHPREMSAIADFKDLRNLNGYWPALVKPGADFSESALAIGPLVLLLLAFVRRSNWKAPGVTGLGAVGVIAFLLAVGTPLNRLFYFLVPGWSASGSPGRIAVLFVLVACVLAGLGASRLAANEGRPKNAWLMLLVLGAFLTAMTPLLIQGGYPALIMKAISTSFFNSIPWIGACLALATVVVGVRVKKNEHRSLLLLGAAALFGIALYNGVSPVPTGTIIPTRTDLPVSMDRVAIVNDQWGLLSPGEAFTPSNFASLYRIHELGGYDSLIDRDTVGMLQDVDGQNPSPAANGNMMFIKSTADPKKLVEAGVSEVWSSDLLPLFGKPLKTTPYNLYKLDGPGRAYTPRAAAAVVEEGYDHQKVEARGPGPLIVKDRNMPGWTAEVDGKPTPITGSMWRQVDLPEGDHQVIFRYTPPGLFTGIILGVLGWLMWVLAFLASRRGSPKSKSGANTVTPEAVAA